MTADHQTWVPHLRGVFVFAAKVGYHERKSADVLRTLNVVKGKDPRLLFHGFGWNNVHHPTAVNSLLIPPPRFHARGSHHLSVTRNCLLNTNFFPAPSLCARLLVSNPSFASNGHYIAATGSVRILFISSI
jgi:hypothetical protein